MDSEFVSLRSVWLLQMYASRIYSSGAVKDAGIEAADAPMPTLVASLLCTVVEERLHRDLSVGFARRSSKLHRVRGKINVFATARHQLLEKGQVHCDFNELTFDNEVNRYILFGLAHGETVLTRLGEKDVASRCRRLVRTLRNAGVSFSNTAHHPYTRLAPEDRKPVDATTLLLSLQVPSDLDAGRVYRRAKLTEHELRRLFEEALLGLYRVHLEPEGWKVHPPKQLTWPVEGDTNALLPVMRTDIMLETPEGNAIIVDAKFTSMATSRSENYSEKLKSGHLYQIYSYVMAYATSHPNRLVAGAMVYGQSGAQNEREFPVIQQFTMYGHPFLFAALDLEQSPFQIRSRAVEAAKRINAEFA